MVDRFNEQSVWHGPTLDDFADTSLTQAGDPYVYGHEVNLNDPNPPAFDCSELVQWTAAQHGIRIVDGAENQRDYLQNEDALIPVSEALQTRGALLFHITPGPGGDHVAISLGNGQTSEARSSSHGVGVFDAEGRDWTHAGIIPGFQTDSVYPWEGSNQSVDWTAGHEPAHSDSAQQAHDVAPWEDLPQSADPNMDATSAPEPANQESADITSPGGYPMPEGSGDYGYRGDYSDGYASAGSTHPDTTGYHTDQTASNGSSGPIDDPASANGFTTEGHSTTENAQCVLSPGHPPESDAAAVTRDPAANGHTDPHVIDGGGIPA